MKLFLLLILNFLFSIFKSFDDFPIDDDVYVLTDLTEEYAFSQLNPLMILFYAPWCGHCKKFYPEYKKASKELRKKNIYLAKVDATHQRRLKIKNRIRGFPTVYFYHNGTKSSYGGKRTKDDLIKWIEIKLGPPFVNLNEDDIEKFKKENEICIVYYGNDNDILKIYENVSRKYDEVFKFAIVNEFKNKNDKNLIKLFKNFDEGENVLDTQSKEFNEKSFIDFIRKYSVRKILKFDNKIVNSIRRENTKGIFLIYDKLDEEKENYYDILKKIQPKNEDLKFIYLSNKSRNEKNFIEAMQIDSFPTLLILDGTNEEGLKKYKIHENILNEKIINDFIDKFRQNKLEPFYKSEPIPEKNDGNVFKIVGKNFEKEVLKSNKDVLIKFYAPWCGHCKKLAPVYEQLAIKYKDNNNLLIGEIDATANEIPGVHISGYPTIKFWRGVDKKVIDYNYDRKLEDFETFLTIHSKGFKKKDGKNKTEL
jgi:protein disulfide-isomerase A1